MLRISIQSVGSTLPARLLIFNPVGSSLSDLISRAGVKLNVSFDGCKVNVYLSLGGQRALVEEVGEIRDGDLLMFEIVMTLGDSIGGEEGVQVHVKDEDRDMRRKEGSEEKEEEMVEEEVVEVEVKRPPPVVIDMCDDSDSDSGSESHRSKPEAPLKYSWMEKEDAGLLTSEDEDEDEEDDASVISVSSDSESEGGHSDHERDISDMKNSEAKNLSAPPSHPLPETEAEAEAGADTGAGAGGAPPARKKRKTVTKSKSSAVEKLLIYGYINPIDLPMAPGTIDSPLEDSSTADPAPSSSSSSSSADTNTDGVPTDTSSLVKVKARIAKMLQLGLHPTTSEAEAQQAMRVAQKLLHKFNLTQAAVMLSQSSQADKDSALNDVEALQGGLVTVQIRRVVRSSSEKNCTGVEPGTGLPYTTATTNSWMMWLANAVADNFQVKCYYNGPSSKYTFYGLKTNTQLAAYAFKIAVEKIVIMKDLFVPAAGEYEERRRRGLTLCASKVIGLMCLMCRVVSCRTSYTYVYCMVCSFLCCMYVLYDVAFSHSSNAAVCMHVAGRLHFGKSK
jgi:hypothetical protein